MPARHSEIRQWTLIESQLPSRNRANREHENSVSTLSSSDGESSFTSMPYNLQPPSTLSSPNSSDDSVREEVEYIYKESATAPGAGNLVIKYPQAGSRRSHLRAMRKNMRSIQDATLLPLVFDELIERDGKHAVKLEGVFIKDVTQAQKTERRGSRRNHSTRITYEIELGEGKDRDAATLQSIIGVGEVVGHAIKAIPRVMDYERWQDLCEDMIHRSSMGSGRLSRPGTGGSHRSYGPSAASSFRSRGSTGEIRIGPKLPFYYSQQNPSIMVFRKQSNVSGESILSAQRSVPGGGSVLGESTPSEIPQEGGPSPQVPLPGRRRRCRAFLSRAGKALKRWMRRS